MCTQEDFEAQAWEIRRDVSQKIIARRNMEHLQECWDASITDTQRGFAKGPFYSVQEVTKEVGAEEWIAMPRFAVLQRSSVRPVDDGRIKSKLVCSPLREVGGHLYRSHHLAMPPVLSTTGRDREQPQGHRRLRVGRQLGSR